MAIPKLGPTGKKIATGAAIAGALTFGGLIISNRAEKKRVAGADATYDKKYPLSNNLSMTSFPNHLFSSYPAWIIGQKEDK